MSWVGTAAVNFVLSFFSMEGQPGWGVVRFVLSLIAFFVFTTDGVVTGNGRLRFICQPKTNDVHKELCFSQYSTEMNPLMRLYHFFLVTALILVVLWIAMIRYSYIHFKKVRGEFPNQREHLGQEFFKWFLCHAVTEAVLALFILVLFLYTQKILLVDEYYCNHHIGVEVLCKDKGREDKQFFNFLFIAWILFTIFFCIGAVVDVLCNKENLIKELFLDLDTTVNGAEKKGDRDSSNLTEEMRSQFPPAGTSVPPSSSDTNQNPRQRGSAKKRKSRGGRKR